MDDLLNLSRKAIEGKFSSQQIKIFEKIKKKYSEKKACFVTLTKNGILQGCIGSLYPKEELWKNVIENSINAAFYDPRFLPLQKTELNEVKIEISVLSLPEKLFFKNPDDLLKKIKFHPGIILKKGSYSATYLPQVWKQIENEKSFLESLSLKAGLDKDSWKTSEIWTYSVESVNEK